MVCFVDMFKCISCAGNLYELIKKCLKEVFRIPLPECVGCCLCSLVISSFAEKSEAFKQRNLCRLAFKYHLFREGGSGIQYVLKDSVYGRSLYGVI